MRYTVPVQQVETVAKWNMFAPWSPEWFPIDIGVKINCEIVI